MNRNGEKLGWTIGWLGSFLWLAILSTIWFFQNKVLYGTIGLLIFCFAIVVIFMFAPYRCPKIHYWKLMLPLYMLIIVSIILCLYAYPEEELSSFSMLSLTPCLLPLFTLGKKTWEK